MSVKTLKSKKLDPDLDGQIRESSRGFTLIELLAVMAVMTILLTLVVPMLTLSKSDYVSSVINTMGTSVEQARTYAMAKNTYVYMGFIENNAALAPDQTSTGTGRVIIQVFSSLDGTDNLDSANIIPLTKPLFLNNVDIPGSLSDNTPAGLTRPAASYTLCLNGTSTDSVPSPTSSITSGRFTFNKIVEFDPQGTLHIPSDPVINNIGYLEIDLQPTHGNSVGGAASLKDSAAVQIDGLTGAVLTYRP